MHSSGFHHELMVLYSGKHSRWRWAASDLLIANQQCSGNLLPYGSFEGAGEERIKAWRRSSL